MGAFGGALSSLTAGDLGAIILKEMVSRSGIDPERIDDVVFGHGYPSGEAPAIGRWASLAAGLPVTVPGYQIDRRCGSGLQAVIEAAMMVQTGAADVVIAGAAESMSNVEHYSTQVRRGRRLGGLELHDRLIRARERAQPEARFGPISGMIETAENLARDFSISREACDAYALRSHRNAANAWHERLFDREIVPVKVPQRRGDPIPFERDEGFRAEATMESLGSLRPLEGGVVTAGNASQQSDAAAACLVVAEDMLGPLGLQPDAWLHSWAVVGCDPSRMGIGPVPAVAKLFARTGLGWDEIDLVELNEAFASQVLAVLMGWGWSADDSRMDKLNLLGSGISLGHPIGATGLRILASMVGELHRRQARFGLETMCIGGGQGIAALIERAS